MPVTLPQFLAIRGIPMTKTGDNPDSQAAYAPQAPSGRVYGFLLVPGFALMSYASAIEPLRAAKRHRRPAVLCMAASLL